MFVILAISLNRETQNLKAIAFQEAIGKDLFQYYYMYKRFPLTLNEAEIKSSVKINPFKRIKFLYKVSTQNDYFMLASKVNSPWIVYCHSNVEMLNSQSSGIACLGGFAFDPGYIGERIDFPIYGQDKIFLQESWPSL